jgi:hypothetical protein
MKKAFAVILLMLLFVTTGCFSSPSTNKHGDNIRDYAVDVDQAAERIRELEHGVLEKTEKLHTEIAVAMKAMDDVAPFVPEENRSLVYDAKVHMMTADELRSSIVADVFAVDKKATEIAKAVKGVKKESGKVRDAPSFLSDILVGLKWLLFVIVGTVVLALGWRFGLDKLIAAFAKILAGWVEWLGSILHRKLDGPAKLFVEGKPSEALAALRATDAAFDKIFKEAKANAKG